jgi:uncharacterized membrane protein
VVSARGITAIVLAVAAGGALAALSIYVLHLYGLALFLGVPFVLGFVSTALLPAGQPPTFARCAGAGVLAALVLSLLFLGFGWEGLICIVMAVPLAIPGILLGAAVAYRLVHQRDRGHGASATMLLVAAVAALTVAEAAMRSEPRTIYLAEDAQVVNAEPARVWSTIVTLGELAPPADPLLHTGIAVPRRTKIVQACNGGLRVCTLSTGVLVERIDAWQPSRRLAWRALDTPPPMRELNPLHEVDAPHLHGFYTNVRGEFALEPLGGGRTRLVRRTWYRLDLYPGAYWRIWCDFGASRIHRFVLEHVRREAERRRGERQA